MWSKRRLEPYVAPECSCIITNSKDYAQQVEEGWEDNPEYGWKAKGGYHVVGNNTGTAAAILEAVANKVSKM